MVEFGIGFGGIIVLCVMALVIDSRRAHRVIDNSGEYKRMFEEGVIQHLHKHTHH